MIEKSLLKNIDWILISLLLINSVIGVVVIYSSSYHIQGNFFIKQMIWIFISFIVLILLLSIDYKILVMYSLYFYILLIAILGGLLVLGSLMGTNKSWINFSVVSIQPSELTKIGIILLMAYLFSNYRKEYISWKKGSVSVLIFIIPFILVALQPDLGTAISYISILLAVFILAGMRRNLIIFLLILVMIVGLVGWNFYLKDYQKQRISTFIFPGKDPLGSSYHILQSKIAVGSGGFFGKGYIKGTQSQLKFLPARHTDFIFSVIGEEFGFIGIFLIIIIYSFFILRLFNSVNKSRDRTGVYLVFMIAMLISFQFFINVFMVIGLFPITGIPLPLLSYGGSSILTNYIALSLVINVKMRRFVNV